MVLLYIIIILGATLYINNYIDNKVYGDREEG
jgi:hypothetical protein